MTKKPRALGKVKGRKRAEKFKRGKTVRRVASKRSAATNPRPTVLIVDDDAYYRQNLREKLDDRDLTVLEAGSADEAIAISAKTAQQVAVALIDVRLPGGAGVSATHDSRGAGIDVAKSLRERNSQMRIIGMSNHTTEDMRTWFLDHGHAYIEKQLITFEASNRSYLDLIEEAARNRRTRKQPRCFIVHGHDHSTVHKLQKFIVEELGWPAVTILVDLPARGRTIIEMFEEEARHVDVVFVLLTPDERAALASAPQDVKWRARQNVIFELGFFYAKLQRTRGRVLLLHKGEVEIPSDIRGVRYIDISNGIPMAGKLIRNELDDFWKGAKG